VEAASDLRFQSEDVREDVAVPLAQSLLTLAAEESVLHAVPELVMDHAADFTGVGAVAHLRVEVDRTVPVGVAAPVAVHVALNPLIRIEPARIELLEQIVDLLDRIERVPLVLARVRVRPEHVERSAGSSGAAEERVGAADHVHVDVRTEEARLDGPRIDARIGNRPLTGRVAGR